MRRDVASWDASMSETRAEVGVRALGVDVQISISGGTAQRFAEAARDRWAYARLPGTSSVRSCAVDYHLGEGTTDDELRANLVGLTHAVTEAAVQQRAGELVMLHGAAIAHPGTRRAIAVVAPGNTGKTTFACALGAGRSYLTDETVGIDDDGRIVPYAKPLSIRRPDGSGVKDEIFPGDRGLLQPIEDAELAAIVLLARDGTADPYLEELDTLDAIAALAPESSSVSKLPTPLKTLASLIERVGVRRVHYRDVHTLESLVAEVVSA